MTNQELFHRLIGRWRGSCRTWFEPDQLADESPIEGSFAPVLGGLFLRHTYEGSLRAKPRRGEEMLAFNTVTNAYQATWVDDFHMNYAIMYSEGTATERGFSLLGSYDVAPEQPRWRWRTTYELLDENRLRIIAYNVSPEGVEAKAVETLYHRER